MKNGLKIAKTIYYILIFGWLFMISTQGYTNNLIPPTIILIIYGMILSYKTRKNNKNQQ